MRPVPGFHLAGFVENFVNLKLSPTLRTASVLTQENVPGFGEYIGHESAILATEFAAALILGQQFDRYGSVARAPDPPGLGPFETLTFCQFPVGIEVPT